MYAIIETGGKQYKVEAGDVIYIEKLGAEEASEYTFDKVIAVEPMTASRLVLPMLKAQP